MSARLGGQFSVAWVVAVSLVGMKSYTRSPWKSSSSCSLRTPLAPVAWCGQAYHPETR